MSRQRFSRRLTVRLVEGMDERFHLAKSLRKESSHVEPKHHSFLWGELALYSFVVLLLSGTFLALFFHPDSTDTVYTGSYSNLRGVHVSRAYDSAVRLSFDVRAGLFVRQVHHWAANIFLGSIALHMWRNFFTGAFRKPRELTWIGGVLMLILAMVEGFTGYSMIDDLLSGMGVRIVSGLVLSVPVIGSWLHWMIFGGEFAGTHWIGRFYIVHVLLIPGLLLALVGSHLGLVWYQKHTQYRGQGATESNVVGDRAVPGFGLRTLANGLCVVGVIALLGGLFQINPIYLWGPYSPADTSTGAQPDWYIGFIIGGLRIFPPWDIHLGPWTISAPFWPGLVLPALIFGFLALYPYLEAWLTRDRAQHNLLQRPRDNPVRTALGAAMLTFWAMLSQAGQDDVFGFAFQIPFQWLRWAERVAVLVLPPIVFWVTLRVCRRLQRRDRAVLIDGLPTGLIQQRPGGSYVEVRQPHGGLDEAGRPVPLLYGGARVDHTIRTDEPAPAEPTEQA
jgi:ubiquinol-cytochrome c reductase cytochrome b subunit